MTDRKEERERLRQGRLAAHQAASSSEKRLQYVGYAVAGLIVAAIVAALFVAVTSGDDGEGPGVDSQGNAYPDLAFIQDDVGAVPDGVEVDGREGTAPPPVEIGDLDAAADAANCELRLDLRDEGNEHFNDDGKDVDYGTSPPTSGDHYSGNEAGSGALADGAYLTTPAMTRGLHALEHGRVQIQYSPDLPEAEQLEIKGVFEESPQGTILFPNADMPYDVAITAWTHLAGCETYEGGPTLDVLRAFRDTYRFRGPEFFPPSISG